MQRHNARARVPDAIGIGPLNMVVISEMFPFRLRAVAMSLALFLNRLVSGAVPSPFRTRTRTRTLALTLTRTLTRTLALALTLTLTLAVALAAALTRALAVILTVTRWPPLSSPSPRCSPPKVCASPRPHRTLAAPSPHP